MAAPAPDLVDDLHVDAELERLATASIEEEAQQQQRRRLMVDDGDLALTIALDQAEAQVRTLMFPMALRCGCDAANPNTSVQK